MSLKGFFRWYICVDVILVHIKTRLDLLGIQTFSRWDQRLGRQYSNLNRHIFCTIIASFSLYRRVVLFKEKSDHT